MKTLLVLGASSDMGMALIRRIHPDFDRIIAHYFHMNEELQDLKENVGEKMMLLQADLSAEEEVHALIRKIRESGASPSHIVHFPAPRCQNAKFHKIGWEVFQREYDISLKSLVLVLQAFLPEMAKASYGRVAVMLSNVVSHAAPAYCANYVVTKYALLGLVKALASEYAAKGITVNGVSPTWVNTKYIDNQPDILKEKFAAENPLGRNLEAEEIVPTIAFLLSDDAACISGENITIACGR